MIVTLQLLSNQLVQEPTYICCPAPLYLDSQTNLQENNTEAGYIIILIIMMQHVCVSAGANTHLMWRFKI